MNHSGWLSHVLCPLLSDNPAGETFPEGARATVLAADVDKIQAYVFESDKLPEIRGASRQITGLNTSAIYAALDKQGLPSDCVLYAQGGSVLALLPPDGALADAVAGDLERAYPDATGAATNSVVWRTFTVEELLGGFGAAPEMGRSQARINAYFRAKGDKPTQEDIANRKHFGEITLLMGRLLRCAKEERAHAPFFELMPYAEPCASCRTRPASRRAYIDEALPGDRGRPICAICDAKREQGRARSHWIGALADDFREFGYPLEAEALYPEDITQITNDGDVAFVYADGDAIGDKLQFIPTPAAYRDFSAGLHQITRRAVASAIAQSSLLPYTYGGSRVYPWEVLAIGGDDVLAMVPADAALRFVTQLAATFAELGKDLNPGGRPLTMSVGFAIAKPKTPVRLLRDTAEKALKSAKKHRAYSTKPAEPAIDFHNFIKEGMPGAELARGGEPFTGRPYTLSEMKQLDTGVERLRSEGFPRSQLYSMCAELGLGQVRGSLFYYYQRARLTEGRRDVLDGIKAEWTTEQDRQMWPWLERIEDDAQTRIYTVLLDMVDLL